MILLLMVIGLIGINILTVHGHVAVVLTTEKDYVTIQGKCEHANTITGNDKSWS